jgi:hypothetical protein
VARAILEADIRLLSYGFVAEWTPHDGRTTATNYLRPVQAAAQNSMIGTIQPIPIHFSLPELTTSKALNGALECAPSCL